MNKIQENTGSVSHNKTAASNTHRKSLVSQSASVALDPQALTLWGGVLSIVSTVVGGGIVGLPTSMLILGLYPSLGIMAVMSYQTCNFSWLYLNAKDLIEGKPESLFEIGYILFARSSIFVISFILFVTSFGMTMIYLIIFGNTAGSVVKDIFAIDPDLETGFKKAVTQKWFFVVLLALLLMPVILKKELQELHIVSMMLFYAVLAFIFILFLQLCFLGTSEFSEDQPIDFQDFQKPYADADFVQTINALSPLLVSYAFATNLFPMFSALQVKTNQNCHKGVQLSVVLISGIYVFLSIVAVFLFGKDILNENADIMGNINKEYSIDPDRWESFVLRFMFLVVLACHIPFVYFFGKEALLIIIDELDRRSISDTLEIRKNQLLETEKRLSSQQAATIPSDKAKGVEHIEVIENKQSEILLERKRASKQSNNEKRLSVEDLDRSDDNDEDRVNYKPLPESHEHNELGHQGDDLSDSQKLREDHVKQVDPSSSYQTQLRKSLNVRRMTSESKRPGVEKSLRSSRRSEADSNRLSKISLVRETQTLRLQGSQRQ